MAQEWQIADKAVCNSSPALAGLDCYCKRQQTYYYIMTDLLNHVAWQFDIATMTVVDVSPSVKQLRGYEPEDIVGRSMNEVFTTASYCSLLEKLPGWLNLVAGSPDGRCNFVGLVEQPHRDGLTVWAEMAICLLTCEDGGVEAVGISRDVGQQNNLDITQLKAEREAVLRLREFSRMMPGLGLIVDTEATVVEMFDDNRLLTQSVEEAKMWPGMGLARLLPAAAARQLMQAINYAIDKNRVQFGEFILDMAQGRRIFSIRIAPLSCRREGKGTAACYFTDITDQSRTKKQLQLTYEKQRQRDLLNQLAEGKTSPSQEVLDQAWQVKLNLAQDFSCYLLVFTQWAGQERREERQRIVDSLLAVLNVELGVIAWESKDGIALLASAGTGGHSVEQELEKAERWQEIMGQYAPETEYHIGIAEFHAGTFWQFSKVYAQARMAVELGRKLTLGQVVYHYLDIGVFQFFPAILDRSHVTDFIRRTLGKLIEYDRAQGTELVDTLERILQTDNLKVVAEQFFVHRQTILFRKRRIEIVLGSSLDNFETRLALGMALKFRQVFGGDM